MLLFFETESECYYCRSVWIEFEFTCINAASCLSNIRWKNENELHFIRTNCEERGTYEDVVMMVMSHEWLSIAPIIFAPFQCLTAPALRLGVHYAT